MEVQSENDDSVNGKYFESDINSGVNLPVFRHLVNDRLIYWFKDRWAVGAKSNMDLEETPILQSQVGSVQSQAWEMTWDEAVVQCGKEKGKILTNNKSFKSLMENVNPWLSEAQVRCPLLLREYISS